MTAVAEPAIGRERRRHGRWRVEGGHVAVSGQNWPLVDISIGGFQARAIGDLPPLSPDFEGNIVWRQGREAINFHFRASVVRRDAETGFLAAEFEPLEGEEIDTLLRMLSAIEEERYLKLEREQRAAARRIFLRRALVTGVALGSIGLAVYLFWLFGLSGA